MDIKGHGVWTEAKGLLHVLTFLHLVAGLANKKPLVCWCHKKISNRAARL